MNERITWPVRTAAWLSQNSTELLIGLAVALALVALMLMLRSVGHRIVASDPHCRTWRSVIGRVLAKTSLLFMVVTALGRDRARHRGQLHRPSFPRRATGGYRLHHRRRAADGCLGP